MLKYENIEIGTTIAAYDFPAFAMRVEGKVVNHETHNGAKMLIVRCERDFDENGDASDRRVGEFIFVPMETMTDEIFKQDRVQVID